MADISLFARLKRLFSNDVIVRNIGGTQIKIADVNKIQTSGKYQTNSLLDKFSRLYIYNNRNIFNPTLNYQTLRIQLYSDYEAMDTDPIVASALDILADEATLKNEQGDIISIKSSDENIRRVLDNLFYDILNIEFNLWSWTRNLCKYGDFFLKLEIAEKFGVYNVLPYTVYHMIRREGDDPKNPTKVYFQLDPDGIAASQSPNYMPRPTHNIVQFENYEVAHFRLLSDTNYLPYGRCLPKDSYIEVEGGVKQIHELERGDKVWTYNRERDLFELEDVIATCSSGVKKIIKINTRYNTIRCSEEHPLLTYNVQDAQFSYKKAIDLSLGDLLCASGKELVDPKYNISSNVRLTPILSIEVDGEEETFDIQVSGTNSNFVCNGLIVHNSYIEPARKIYKQLTLMEDAMLIHRIMRAPERRIFYINIGQIPPAEVEQFMQKTITGMKKTPYIGEDGQYNLRFNLQNMMEDFFIPVRGGDNTTKIETAPGLQYDGITDVQYLQSKMFAALKIPKAYFGFEGELRGKATLAAEDIRFARTVERIQKILESELTKIALVHLYAQGFTGESLTNFEIKLTVPSIVFEQEKIALLKEKIDLANQMKDTKLFPSDYIYETIFNLSEDRYNEMRELVREDSKRLFRLAQIENEGNDPAISGMSYGTPHDLASMYGRRSVSTPKGAGLGEVPLGYEEIPPHGQPGPEGGRPREKMSVYGTNENPVGGRDVLGRQGMHGGFPSDNEYVMENVNTKAIYYRNQDSIKEMVFKKKDESEEESNLLNENNIRDLDNETYL